MKVNMETIAEILNHGDTATAIEIVQALLKRVDGLATQTDSLKHAVSEERRKNTELISERNRLEAAIDALRRLCADNGLSIEAAKITWKTDGAPGRATEKN